MVFNIRFMHWLQKEKDMGEKNIKSVMIKFYKTKISSTLKGHCRFIITVKN